MPLNYLSKAAQFCWIILLILCFLIFGILAFLGLGLLYAGLLILYRKNPLRLNEAATTKSDVLFSPVNGQIKSVRSLVDHEYFGEGLIEVQILIPWWKEWGLYLPANLEVVDRIFRPEKALFRYRLFAREDKLASQLQGHYISLARSGGDHLGIHFAKCFLGSSAQINLQAGDKGRLGARFGYFPWGGTALLYLPGNYEILAKTGEQVVAGETPVATQL